MTSVVVRTLISGDFALDDSLALPLLLLLFSFSLFLLSLVPLVDVLVEILETRVHQNKHE